VDRYGALPAEVKTLFAVASLRVTCAELGVEEVSTFRNEVRLKPVTIPDATPGELSARVATAAFHPETRTLNLSPERLFGIDLVRWVEERLREAAVRSALP
jgi:transcription-repair coupling factor (superfamily II helicase)